MKRVLNLQTIAAELDGGQEGDNNFISTCSWIGCGNSTYSCQNCCYYTCGLLTC